MLSVCSKSLFLKLTSDLLSLSPCPLSPRKGVNTGTGVPATRLGATPQTPFLITIEVFRQSKAPRHSGGAFYYHTSFANRRQTHHKSERVSITVILDFTTRYRLIDCELDCRSHHRTEPCVAEFLCGLTDKIGP